MLIRRLLNVMVELEYFILERVSPISVPILELARRSLRLRLRMGILRGNFDPRASVMCTVIGGTFKIAMPPRYPDPRVIFASSTDAVMTLGMPRATRVPVL